MRPVTLFFALLLLAGCQIIGPDGDVEDEIPRTVPFDDRGLSPEARGAYREIAAQLTVRYLDAHPEHPAAGEVALPQSLWDAYYHFALHLGESEAFARTGARYPAFLPDYHLRSLLLRVDTTLAWTQALRAGQMPTGNAAFDALAVRYDLSHRAGTSFLNWLDVYTDTTYNVRALVPLLEVLPGVEHVSLNGFAGDGNHLTIEPERLGWRVSYYVGSGDCPAGCIYWDTYVFSLSPGGTVRLIDHSNEPPPRPTTRTFAPSAAPAR